MSRSLPERPANSGRYQLVRSEIERSVGDQAAEAVALTVVQACASLDRCGNRPY
jgi:hypothetical protein